MSTAVNRDKNERKWFNTRAVAPAVRVSSIIIIIIIIQPSSEVGSKRRIARACTVHYPDGQLGEESGDENTIQWYNDGYYSDDGGGVKRAGRPSYFFFLFLLF